MKRAEQGFLPARRGPGSAFSRARRAVAQYASHDLSRFRLVQDEQGLAPARVLDRADDRRGSIVPILVVGIRFSRLWQVIAIARCSRRQDEWSLAALSPPDNATGELPGFAHRGEICSSYGCRTTNPWPTRDTNAVGCRPSSIDAHVDHPGESQGLISAALASAMWGLWHLPITSALWGRWEIAFRAADPGLWMFQRHVLMHTAFGMVVTMNNPGIHSPFDIQPLRHGDSFWKPPRVTIPWKANASERSRLKQRRRPSMGEATPGLALPTMITHGYTACMGTPERPGSQCRSDHLLREPAHL